MTASERSSVRYTRHYCAELDTVGRQVSMAVKDAPCHDKLGVPIGPFGAVFHLSVLKRLARTMSEAAL